MRGFVILFFFACFLVLQLPHHWYLQHLYKKNPEKSFEKSYRMIKRAFGIVLKIAGADIEVHGQENIPEGACVFVSNHRSYFDILLTHNTATKPVGFIAKIELSKFPLLHLYMKDIGCTFVDRNDPRQAIKTMQKGIENLKLGHSMAVCPEGTRNQTPDMLPFKEGSLKLAERAKVPVVPLAIIDSDKLLESNGGTLRFRKAKVKMIYGEPYYLSDIPEEYRRANCAYSQMKIQELMDAYKDEAK